LSFGNELVYPFPAVQYIPLTLTMLQQGLIPKKTFRSEQPRLIVGVEINLSREAILREYEIEGFPATDSNSFPILALNLEIEAVKYRGYYVTMVGQKKVGTYQYYTIPSNYFYKKNLFFELYNIGTAEKLANTSITLK
jgi:hypothetical protein